MTAPIWLTPSGDLGIIPEEEYYEFFFDAYNPSGGDLTYSLISGELPAGLEVRPNGTMIGIPVGRVAGVTLAVPKVTTSTFTLRIKNSANIVADRTFSLTVAGILPQIFSPSSGSLGTYLDGTYVYIDINTIEPNRFLQSVYTIIEGELPPGLSFDRITGIIKGYITPTVSNQSLENTGFDNSPYDVLDYDFTGVSISKNYQFTIKADNSITIETETYQINVIAISSLSADSAEYTADNDSIITSDILGPKHNPVILNDQGIIATVRQNTNAKVQIVALDYENDTLTYEIVGGSLPPGLQLDSTTGYIFGTIPFGQLNTTSYTFSVQVYKTDFPFYVSSTKTFIINLLGQISDIVEWKTNKDLGILYTGQISELFVLATVPSGRVLNYRLAGEYGTLPYGLNLTEDGLITGRVSFETFMLDSNTTIFDGNQTKFDKTFSFKVAAFDVGDYVYDVREFTIRIVDQDIKPYENLYIQALPTRDQRDRYNSVISNSDTFPENYIYRSSDPWFGKNFSRRSLFLSGLNPEEAEIYIQSMQLNHYWKNLNFGEIKTARAVDDNFNVIYEVVYIELLDRQVNRDGVGPNLAVSLPPNSRQVSTIYPNSFPNMAQRVADGIGYQNRGILPRWMTSRQEDGSILGFQRVLVLCYTKPGRSAEIAYRARLVQDEFKFISFEIDRYVWDNSLSSVYNKDTQTFTPNNFTSGTGLITANTNSNVVLGINANISGSGTISGVSGNNVVTGNLTSFNTELRIGKPLYDTVSGNLLGIISSIKSATVLTLSLPLNSTFSNLNYTATISNTEFITDLHVGDTLLNNANVILGTVKTITSDSSLVLYSNCLANISSGEFNRSNRDPYSIPGDNDKYLKYPQVGVIS
jgi:hypothetical protein